MPGLGKYERFAELLGHELAHAAWSLADVDRARFAQRLEIDMQEMSVAGTAAARSTPLASPERVSELLRLKTEVERPAEEAETVIWKELRAGQRVPRAK